jgi:hypothetical protein
MRHLATSLAMSLSLAHGRAADDHRRADEWRALHRRPDALPYAAEAIPAPRRRGVTELAAHLRRSSPARG